MKFIVGDKIIQLSGIPKYEEKEWKKGYYNFIVIAHRLHSLYLCQLDAFTANHDTCRVNQGFQLTTHDIEPKSVPCKCMVLPKPSLTH